MIGKLLIPLAIGGGLILLLSSSAKAESAPRNPFDALPANLRQLTAQAQATNDPAMLEMVAAQLEGQGFPQAAGVLRQQANRIRQARGESAAAPSAAAPSAAAPSFVPSAAPVPAASSTASPPPFVPPAESTAPRLSAEFQKMVAEAIQNGTVPVLTSTAFVLERAGFPEIAADLRERARQAAANVPPPPAKDRPNVALDTNMPADLALEVARQMQLQGDPAALEALARELRMRGFSTTAEQLEAKAKQIRAMLDAARTMHDIDQEFKTPGVVGPMPSAPAPAAPAPRAPAPAPAPSPVLPSAPLPAALPPAQEFPLTVTATPPAPLPVPVTPQPQPTPVEKSKGQILAEAVATSLNDLIARYGSVPKARYKEDKGLVTRFQSQEGLTTDGNYGPKSAERVARYVSDVPPPFYWPKGAGQKDLNNYRSNLHTLALEAEQLGNVDRAERLRASALKASLA
jgi:hypothetical protein